MPTFFSDLPKLSDKMKRRLYAFPMDEGRAALYADAATYIAIGSNPMDKLEQLEKSSEAVRWDERKNPDWVLICTATLVLLCDKKAYDAFKLWEPQAPGLLALRGHTVRLEPPEDFLDEWQLLPNPAVEILIQGGQSGSYGNIGQLVAVVDMVKDDQVVVL